MSVLAFDLETIPDADLLRLALSMPDAGDDEVIEVARADAIEKSGGRSDFLPLAYHKIVVVSIVLRKQDRVVIDSKAPPEHDEADAIRSFFGIVDRIGPTLVSWNGSGFDLPVLAMRMMRHGIVSPGYWQGPGDKWRQYTSRFHDAHHDLMDIIAHRNLRAASKLETMSLACGLPGKMGYAGDQVLEMHRSKRHSEISAYCEIDALNTYLLWNRFQMVSGHLPPKRYEEEEALVEAELASSSSPHLKDFGERWVKARSALGSLGSST